MHKMPSLTDIKIFKPHGMIAFVEEYLLQNDL